MVKRVRGTVTERARRAAEISAAVEEPAVEVEESVVDDVAGVLDDGALAAFDDAQERALAELDLEREVEFRDGLADVVDES